MPSSVYAAVGGYGVAGSLHRDFASAYWDKNTKKVRFLCDYRENSLFFMPSSVYAAVGGYGVAGSLHRDFASALPFRILCDRVLFASKPAK